MVALGRSCTTVLLQKSEQQKAYDYVGWALPTSPEEEKVRSGQLTHPEVGSRRRSVIASVANDPSWLTNGQWGIIQLVS